MTFTELASVSDGFQKSWVIYKKVILANVGAIVLLAVIWFMPPPSFLVNGGISEYQMEVLINSPGIFDQPIEVPGEKFLVPMLTPYAGTSNQFMEYKAAAVTARSLNRTLCLASFFSGPSSLLGIGSLVSGLLLEDRYDTETLSRFVKVANIEDCIRNCEDRLDARWRLYHTASRWPRNLLPWFKIQPKAISLNLQNYYSFVRNWSSVADVVEVFGGSKVSESKCVGLDGLFPGFKWRGAVLGTASYFRHSVVVMNSTDVLQIRAFGRKSEPFLAVHWRFEESKCRGHQLGLCFTRNPDGSVIPNSQRSIKWANLTLVERRTRVKYRQGVQGIFVAMSDVSEAIYDRAVQGGFRNVYLSSDGWLPARGEDSLHVLRWVVEDLRNKQLNVSGLWQVEGLPNFSDGTYVEQESLQELPGFDSSRGHMSTHLISLIEQEVCIRSSVFLGTGQSTWSATVADARRGLRCRLDLEERIKNESKDPLDRAEFDRRTVDTMLGMRTGGGEGCRVSLNPAEDEAPDGWLDYEVCEGLLEKELPSNCKRISQ